MKRHSVSWQAVIIGIMTFVFLAVSIPAMAQSCCPSTAGKADAKQECKQECKKDCAKYCKKDCKPGDKCDTTCCRNSGVQGANAKAPCCPQGTNDQASCCPRGTAASGSGTATGTLAKTRPAPVSPEKTKSK